MRHRLDVGTRVLGRGQTHFQQHRLMLSSGPPPPSRERTKRLSGEVRLKWSVPPPGHEFPCRCQSAAGQIGPVGTSEINQSESPSTL